MPAMPPALSMAVTTCGPPISRIRMSAAVLSLSPAASAINSRTG
jgi:hypothetical protein